MSDRSLRLARGLTVALAGVAVPVSGHLMAGGAATLSATTLVVLVFVAAVTTAASGREWTLPRILATLVPVQALVHLSMTSGQGHGGAHQPPEHAAASADGAMVVGHLVALVAVALWLRMAERALLAVVALVERLVVRSATPGQAPCLVRLIAELCARSIPRFWTRGVQSRAPPLPSFV